MQNQPNQPTPSIERSFLARVPSLIKSGHSIDEAIKLAFDEEEKFLAEMVNGKTRRSRLVREVLCHSTFTAACQRDFEEKLEAISFGLA
jgi:hypothetical protein